MSKSKPDLIPVGVIIGAHGVRGDVRVKSFTAQPEDVFAYGPLKDERGKTLIDPLSARPAKDHFVVQPKVTLQKEAWDALRGTKLCVPRDQFPAVEDEEYYVTDLIGLSVMGGGEAVIGTVKDVLNHGAGDLLEIDPNTGTKTVLVPFTMADVPVVDMAAGRIVVATFDVWADESKPAPDED